MSLITASSDARGALDDACQRARCSASRSVSLSRSRSRAHRASGLRISWLTSPGTRTWLEAATARSWARLDRALGLDVRGDVAVAPQVPALVDPAISSGTIVAFEDPAVGELDLFPEDLDAGREDLVDAPMNPSGSFARCFARAAAVRSPFRSGRRVGASMPKIEQNAELVSATRRSRPPPSRRPGGSRRGCAGARRPRAAAGRPCGAR